jgi:hypothetical protein
MSNTPADTGAQSYSRSVVAVNALISVVVSLGLVWIVSGFDIFYEQLFRVQPTVEGGGIGANWVAGNEIGWLKIMVDAIHLLDILMGLFILLMVVIHWGAFRRLASRMQQPGEGSLATDGGDPADEEAATSGGDHR